MPGSSWLRPLVVLGVLLSCVPPPARANENEVDEGLDEGLDEDARALAHLVACAQGPRSPRLKVSAGVHDGYCRQLRAHAARYLKRYHQHIEPVLSQVVPRDRDLPVVYPFGGGDLLTALGTFPNAKEITTLSLEHAGDLRMAFRVAPQDLEAALVQTGDNLRRLLAAEHSKTTNLSRMARGSLPAEIAFSLFAIDLWGFEVTGLRYFDLDPEGKVVYLRAEDLEAGGRKPGTAGAKTQPFAHVEISFQKGGEATPRVFRHLAGNLADVAVRKDDRVMKHLRAKGSVLAMTKAASYLLWWDGFSIVREYLAQSAVFMISDSTGLPPDVAQAHGFSQTTYGWFAGPFLPGANKRIAEDYAQTWKAQPVRPIRFHYGYPDVLGRGHLVVSRREETAR